MIFARIVQLKIRIACSILRTRFLKIIPLARSTWGFQIYYWLLKRILSYLRFLSFIAWSARGFSSHCSSRACLDLRRNALTCSVWLIIVHKKSIRSTSISWSLEISFANPVAIIHLTLTIAKNAYAEFSIRQVSTQFCDNVNPQTKSH